MRRTIIFGLLSILMCSFTHAAAPASDDIVGFWKTVDENTGKTQSIVAVYDHSGKYFGRLVVTFNDDGTVSDTIYNAKDRAPAVVGEPFYAGLDIIWDLKKEGEKYSDGSIIDPEKGYVYGAELWREGSNLIVRGELLFVGRNQTWPPALEADFPPGFKKPDLKSLVPVIPEAK